jgi:hypothetical protein
VDGWPVVPRNIAWLGCEVLERRDEVADAPLDHTLFFARVVAWGEGRLGEAPLLYSSRLGWRVTGEKARQAGDDVRDRLLARLAEHEQEHASDGGAGDAP